MKVIFTIHEDESRGEWVLIVHHPNGSYAGLGVLNGKEEAERVRRSLAAAVAEDELESDRWLDYFVA